MVIWYAHADNIINVTRKLKCNTKVFNEQSYLDSSQRIYEMLYISFPVYIFQSNYLPAPVDSVSRQFL